MKQIVITPAMGKRLIGKGMAQHPEIRSALAGGTLVIVAGSTNGYVAEEVLASIAQAEGFTRAGFRRGMVAPGDTGGADRAEFPGDVVIVKGRWLKGKTIFDAAADLRAGDVVLKGANAVNLAAREAGVLIGHPQAGTVGPTLAALAGRRVRVFVPVGVEKRVGEPIMQIASLLNCPQTKGPGMLAIPGEIFTEFDAITLLTGAEPALLAAGGIHGAEGAVWVGLRGTDGQVAAAEKLIRSVASEPLCRT